MLCVNVNDIVIIIIKDAGYCVIIYSNSKFEAIHLLETSVFEDHGLKIVAIYKKYISNKSVWTIKSTTII